ncbi:MAG: HAD family hydrolase [Microgenomates group bacterium]
MTKALLFDFDGTLADTLPFYIQAYDSALRTIGFTFPEKEIVKLCFGKKEDVVCKALNVPEKTELFRTTYFDGVKTKFKDAPLFDGVLELFTILKEKDIKIGIITFAYRWYIDQMVAQYGLSQYVDMVISTDDVKNPKPDPEAVLSFCTRFDLSPADCIVIGDSKSDILMGNAAGSRSVLFHPSTYELFYNKNELLQANPKNVIQTIPELQAYL